MKTFRYLFFCLVLVFFACKGKLGTNKIEKDVLSTKKDKKKTIVKDFSPYLLNGFTVVDTGAFTNGESEGVYAVIRYNGELLDTINKVVGIQPIGIDSYMYLTTTDTRPLDDNMATVAGYKKVIAGNLGEYLLLTGNRKTPLSKLAIGLNNYFSSPWVINQKIYYWAIEKIPGTKNEEVSISAAEFDPKTNSTKKYFLMNDYLETDDSGYYPRPILNNDTIHFELGKISKKFSKDFNPYN